MGSRKISDADFGRYVKMKLDKNSALFCEKSYKPGDIVTVNPCIATGDTSGFRCGVNLNMLRYAGLEAEVVKSQESMSCLSYKIRVAGRIVNDYVFSPEMFLESYDIDSFDDGKTYMLECGMTAVYSKDKMSLTMSNGKIIPTSGYFRMKHMNVNGLNVVKEV